MLPLKVRVVLIVLPAYLAPITAQVFSSTLVGLWAGLLDVFTMVVVPLSCLLALNRIGITAARLGVDFQRRRSFAEFVAASFICSIAMLFSVVVYNVVGNFASSPTMLSRTRQNELGEFASVLMIFYYALSAGVFEEILYRGVLGYVLLTGGRIGIAAYVLVSSLAFCSIHTIVDAADLFSYLYFGMAAAVMYLVFRDLLPVIVGHVVYDVTVGYWLAGAAR